MIELLSTIFEFVKDIISLGVTIMIDVVEFVFGLLGGLLSLLMGLGGIVLVIVLVCVFVRRRCTKKEKQRNQVFIDADGEEFVSFYRQEEKK